MKPTLMAAGDTRVDDRHGAILGAKECRLADYEITEGGQGQKA
jgi:hypothetical protein